LRATFAVATAFTAIMTLWLWRSLPRMMAALESEPDPEKSGGW
jgi:predicted MFS family arabinose efflux permease